MFKELQPSSEEYLERQRYLLSLFQREEDIIDIFNAPELETDYGPLIEIFNTIEQFTQEKHDQQPRTEQPVFPIFHRGLKNLVFHTYKTQQSQGEPITLGGLFYKTAADLQTLAVQLEKEIPYLDSDILKAMYAPRIAKIGIAITEAGVVDTEELVPGIIPPQTS